MFFVLFATGDVQRLQLDADGYLRKIEVEKSKIELLDGKISASQRTIVEQRRRTGPQRLQKSGALCVCFVGTLAPPLRAPPCGLFPSA